MDIYNIYDSLASALGSGIVYRGDDEAQAGHRRDDQYSMATGASPAAVVIPKTVEELATALRLCNEAGVPVTPQGGLTGVVGGAVPIAGAVAISVERMRAVIEIDPLSATMTVEAGVPLQAVQEAADEAGFLFPLDIGSRGSASIGGNAATNAGGNRVLRYGMTRDLVLGMEVVLANGTIITSLNKMIKNNAGYDLKHMFIGSEGTLGIITKLVLRLFPKPESACTAFCGFTDYNKALELLARCRTMLAGTLSAFEVMWPSFYELAETCVPKLPLPHGHVCYVLLDALGSDQKQDQQRFETVLAGALEDGIIADAAIAQSVGESAAMWAIRDSIGVFWRLFGPAAGFDISVPTGEIARFVAYCDGKVGVPEGRTKSLWFGHVADSNLHLMVSCNEAISKDEINTLVYGAVRDYHGSVSAEHGIGLQKKLYLGHTRSPAEVELMRAVKQALDPRAILNPDKVFS